LIVRPDRTFSFTTKSPTTSWLLLQLIGKDKGADTLGKGKFTKQGYLGTISLKHVYEVAKIKKSDETHAEIPLKEICKSVISTAKTLGIQVVE
jgi:large subunit ribosomal protein L11